jgi:hypothetical protein
LRYAGIAKFRQVEWSHSTALKLFVRALEESVIASCASGIPVGRPHFANSRRNFA